MFKFANLATLVAITSNDVMNTVIIPAAMRMDHGVAVAKPVVQANVAKGMMNTAVFTSNASVVVNNKMHALAAKATALAEKAAANYQAAVGPKVLVATNGPVVIDVQAEQLRAAWGE